MRKTLFIALKDDLNGMDKLIIKVIEQNRRKGMRDDYIIYYDMIHRLKERRAELYSRIIELQGSDMI